MRTITRRSFIKKTAGVAGTLSLSTAFSGGWLAFSCTRPQGYFESNFAISEHLCQKILQKALSRGGDFADLYFEHTIDNKLQMSDGRVDQTSGSVDLGVGIRTVKDNQVGYGFTQELTEQSMLAAAETAATIAAVTSKSSAAQFIRLKIPDYYPSQHPLAELPLFDKLNLLKNLNEKCFALSDMIIKARVDFRDQQKQIMVVTSNGIKAEDLLPMSGLHASLIAEKNGQKENAGWALGGRYDFNYYEDTVVNEIAGEAVQRTLNFFESRTPPAGEMPVVLGPGLPGVLLHEAIGHGMEADYNRDKISIYSTMIGRKVAEPFISIIDDGTIRNQTGSINVDDEGALSQKTVLIENGILRSYMHDRISARYYNVEPTGNGRRESYQYFPLPRMRNIYMLPGEHDPEEVIKAVKNGVYAKSILGGQVKLGEGDFAFYVFQGQMIENGKLTYPLRDFNIMGNGPKVLTNVTMIGNDLQLDPTGTGICGKEGQYLPVSNGIPTCLIKSMTVGGLM
jgi:TldD protein